MDTSIIGENRVQYKLHMYKEQVTRIRVQNMLNKYFGD